MSDDQTSTLDALLRSIDDETLAKIVRTIISDVKQGNLIQLQNRGRVVLKNFLQRNAIFAATVTQDGRINIPQAEREKLDIEGGELVQVAIVPIDQTDD